MNLDINRISFEYIFMHGDYSSKTKYIFKLLQ